MAFKEFMDGLKALIASEEANDAQEQVQEAEEVKPVETPPVAESAIVEEAPEPTPPTAPPVEPAPVPIAPPATAFSTPATPRYGDFTEAQLDAMSVDDFRPLVRDGRAFKALEGMSI